MTFSLCLEFNGRLFRMIVERTEAGPKKEIYRVSGGAYYIILQTNRPAALAKGRAVHWTILDGRIRGKGDDEAGASALSLLWKEIERYMSALEKKEVGMPEKQKNHGK